MTSEVEDMVSYQYLCFVYYYASALNQSKSITKWQFLIFSLDTCGILTEYLTVFTI